MWKPALQKGELLTLSAPLSCFEIFIQFGLNMFNFFFSVHFSCRSFSVLVKDLGGKNHQMTILNLLYPIDVKESFKKVL